ncbi:DUF397 domain-containing protein [Streptomyces lasiicapitis]|uniref:DUF397 domain-containing protein n=1 Tax=Streptomyces lasiicapitis TaxID=1923961 RepID=UPI0036AE08C6
MVSDRAPPRNSSVARALSAPFGVHIRDSKLPAGAGPELAVPPTAWATFLAYAARAAR